MENCGYSPNGQMPRDAQFISAVRSKRFVGCIAKFNSVDANVYTGNIITSFPTRGEMLVNLQEQPEGTVWQAGGIFYQYQAGATVIPDMPDWIPVNDIVPEHFGVVGNDTDESTTLQAWLDYGVGRELTVTADKVYRADSTLTIPQDSTIKAYGATFHLYHPVTGAVSPLGRFDFIINPIADVVMGTQTITVTPGDETPYNAGDWIQVYSLTVRYDSVDPLKGEIHQLKSVSSGTLEVNEAFWDNYPLADGIVVRRVTFLPGTNIFGGTWSGLGNSGTQNLLIQLRFMIDCGVFHANISNGWTKGLSFYFCLNYNASYNEILDILSPTQGYGIYNELSSQWGSFFGNKFSGCGSPWDIGGTTSEAGAARFLTFSGNQTYNNIRRVMSVHSNGSDVVISDNHFEASDAPNTNHTGLSIRCGNVTIANNVIYYPDGPSLLSGGIFIENRNFISSVSIIGNTIIGGRKCAIGCTQSLDSGVEDDARLYNLIISNNTFVDTIGAGIVLVTSDRVGTTPWDRVIISNNTMNTTGGASSGIAIQLKEQDIRLISINGNIIDYSLSSTTGINIITESTTTIETLLINSNNIEAPVGVSFNVGSSIGVGRIVGNNLVAGTPVANLPGTVTVI
jgi:hypothetical protein